MNTTRSLAALLLTTFASLGVSSIAQAETITPIAPAPTERLVTQRVVRITADALRPRLPREVKDECEVHDVILGTTVNGKANTLAGSELSLVPDEKAATFALKFTGRTIAKTVGHNGPAVIYSTTTTSFVITKQVVLDDQGMRTLPAQISTETHTHLDAIHSRRRGALEPLVQRIAWREARTKVHQADRITNRSTSARLAKAFDAEVDREIAELAKSNYIQQLVAQQADKNALPVTFSTTAEYIEIVMHGERHPSFDLVSLPKHGGAPVEIILPDSTMCDWQRSLLGQAECSQRVLMAALASHGTPTGALAAIGSSWLQPAPDCPLNVDCRGTWYRLTLGVPMDEEPARVALVTP